MALFTAYAKLQLDPGDNSRMAAFEALCWQHILTHESRDWAIECWEGSIKLQLWTSKTSKTQGFKSYDSKLNRLVFKFVHAYAAAIWPADDTKRSHLAPFDDRSHGMELKALQWQLSVGYSIKQKFKETRDLDLTAEDAMVESKIGQRVRTYLMNLLLFKQPIPHAQSADAATLLQMFLKPPTRKRPHSKLAAATTGISPAHDLGFAPKRSKKERQPSQGEPLRLRSAATDAYQCWLRNCGEVFRTTNEVVLHISQVHMIECRELVTVPDLSDTVTDSISQHLPTVPEPTLHIESSDVKIPRARMAPEQTFPTAANALLQSLQDAEQAGFTFDDEYVAMINRYARG